MLCKRRIIQITPDKTVRNSRDIQIPAGKTWSRPCGSYIPGIRDPSAPKIYITKQWSDLMDVRNLPTHATLGRHLRLQRSSAPSPRTDFEIKSTLNPINNAMPYSTLDIKRNISHTTKGIAAIYSRVCPTVISKIEIPSCYIFLDNIGLPVSHHVSNGKISHIFHTYLDPKPPLWAVGHHSIHVYTSKYIFGFPPHLLCSP